MGEWLGSVITKRRAAGFLLAASLVAGVGGGAASNGAAGHKSRNAGCHPDIGRHVRPLFDKQDGSSASYCLEEALPMGQTDLLSDNGQNRGGYGEMGLVALRMIFAGVKYDCVVPVANQGNGTQVIKVESFSLRNDCLPRAPAK